MGRPPSLEQQLERTSRDPSWEPGSDPLQLLTVYGVRGEESLRRKFCAIFRARKGPQKAGPMVRVRLLSLQRPETTQKDSF